LNKIASDSSVLVYLIFICFIFVIPLNQLAGVRYITATLTFFLGVTNWIEGKKWSSWILIGLACLTHFAFLLPALLLIIFLLSFNFCESHPWIYYLVFILSFFLPDLIWQIVHQISFLDSGVLNDKVMDYGNKVANYQNSQLFRENARWFLIYPYKIIYWGMCFSIFVIRLPYFNLSFSRKSNLFFYLTMMFIVLSNISTTFSNVSYRLMYLYPLFYLSLLLILMKEHLSNRRLNGLILFTLLLFVLKIVLDIRFTVEYTTPSLFFGNLFSILLDDSGQSLWTWIDNLF
jgi:hypothetical protein